MSSAAAAPAVSIIVPVFKAERTLGACLDSLLAQDLADIEVVCVDDGSPDTCPKILADYAARDARVRVISQENAGVSVARNAALDAARGEIVMFADADDAFAPGACSVAAAAFESNPGLEALVFGAACEPADGAPKHVRDLLSPKPATFVRDDLGRVDPALFFGARAQPYVWRSAYRRSLLEREHIRFAPGLALAEDAVFQILAYSLAHETALIPGALYRYRMESASATHEFNAEEARERKVAQHLEAIEALLAEWSERGLAGFYGAETVTWCLDLTLFDIARVDARAAAAFCVRLAAALEGAFGPGWSELPAKGIVRAAAGKVAACDGAGLSMSRTELVRFFVATRGLKQCIERFI